ncbi:N-formylglutamate amidohydrolase [Sphingomonas suaedae]|uniref:N-formylglutamate amidohydrolase n=1 Tax=Sphingomonas suaedae TaxID=2599297 RepID=A0A518RDF5_9SPHN|nr:N-formylglutamate amidohydrolase [Sphingomonas suaedae]QDX25505.1 N-formylglutamate amidohydrolase [Sphingomonas suaedae]
MTPYRCIEGASDVLILCDHASNAVPADIDLGINPALLVKHIAIDIGAGPLAEALAGRLEAPAILAAVSRLVIDFNREPDALGLIVRASDGHAIPGNEDADRDERIARFFAPYHAQIARTVRTRRPALIVAIHSFTPELESGIDEPRPWEAGILYNRDARAANVAVRLLREAGIVTGDNEPYSGRILNATMNRHAEAGGTPYLGIEIRNDLIADDAGVARWCEILAKLVSDVRNHLAQERPAAT